MKLKNGERLLHFTVMCPKCHRHVPNPARFCIYCGQDLHAPLDGREQQAVPASFLHPESAGIPDEPAGNPVNQANAPAGFTPWKTHGPARWGTERTAAPAEKVCPNGHQVTDPSLGFCTICGMPLTEKR